MRKCKILLVEDNPDDEALILMALKDNKLANEVVVARDGQEALDRLFADGIEGPPSVMLLDLKLPKIDGIDVLRRVRADKKTRLLPVVVLTSSDEERDRQRCYGLGANSFVRKPVDYHDFVRAVKELGLYWLIINRPPSD